MDKREELISELKNEISTLSDEEVNQVFDFVLALEVQCSQEPV